MGSEGWRPKRRHIKHRTNLSYSNWLTGGWKRGYEFWFEFFQVQRVVGLNWWVCERVVYLNKLMAVDSFFLPTNGGEERGMTIWKRWWMSLDASFVWISCSADESLFNSQNVVGSGGWIVKRDDFPLMIRKKDKVGRWWEFWEKSAQDTSKKGKKICMTKSVPKEGCCMMTILSGLLYSSLLWSTL